VVDQDAALEFDFAQDGNVHIDPQLGIVYGQAPAVVDDLNLINGIGAQMERELNELGVFRFKQIARWSDANVGSSLAGSSARRSGSSGTNGSRRQSDCFGSSFRLPRMVWESTCIRRAGDGHS